MEQAIGSSQEPGTDWTTMFDSLTPDARSLALVPSRRGSIIALQQTHVSNYVSGGGGVEGRTCVPPCMHNSNAESTAIVLLSFSWAFE